MSPELQAIVIAILASVVSGLATTLVTKKQDSKKEAVRVAEREHDLLRLELKDLQIKLYQLEKDLVEWKDKYYSAMKELISVRYELEDTLVKLSLVHLETNDGQQP
jgi:uncharacterized protein YlxW (UPF0749 family)